MNTPNKTLIQIETATRKAAYNYYTLGMFLPNPDPVLKKMSKDITVYKELRSDSHVWSQIQSRKNGVLAREWYLDRNGASVRNFKIVESLFNDLDIFEIESQVMDAVQFGYQPFELLWQRVGAFVLPTAIVSKPPDWFAFSEENQLLFRTKTNWNGEPTDPRKFICPVYCGTYENPYGEPTLARCFWPVTFKKGGWRYWSTFQEKYGQPTLVGKLPRNRKAEEFEELKEKLDEMIQDAVFVIPDDASVDFIGGAGKSEGGTGFEKLIERCNAEISKAQVGSTLTTELGDTGSYAAAETHMEQQSIFAESDKKLVRSFFTDVIRLIYEINFTESARPKFVIHEEDDIKSALADRDQKLSNKLDFNEDYFEDKYGLDRKYFTLKSAPEPSPNPMIPLLPKEGEFAGKDNSPQIPEPDVEEYNRMAKGILKPVIDLINSGSEYADVMSRLADAYPTMDISQLTQMIQRARFVAQIVGRLENVEK